MHDHRLALVRDILVVLVLVVVDKGLSLAPGVLKLVHGRLFEIDVVDPVDLVVVSGQNNRA